MSPKEIIQHFGGHAAAARAIGITRAAVWQWERAGRVPHVRQYHVETITGGKLKADRGQSSVRKRTDLTQVSGH